MIPDPVEWETGIGCPVAGCTWALECSPTEPRCIKAWIEHYRYEHIPNGW